MQEEVENRCMIESIPNEEMNEVTTINLDLLPTGKNTSGYRTKNDDKKPLERSTITNRGGVVGARCDMVDVIHGRLGLLDGSEEDEDAPATLINLNFTFDSRKSARRIKAAEVTFHFIKTDGCEDEDPAVVRIEPMGPKVLVETSRPVETERSLGVNIGAPPFGGFQAGAELGWVQNTSKVMHDSTRVVGAKSQIDRDYGDDNAASWYLLENSTERSGVPTSMRASILLKRQSDLPFQCVFTMKLEPDLKTAIETSVQTVFGQKVIDDPILFNPTRKPNKRQMEKFTISSLTTTDLKSLSGVVSKTVLLGTVQQNG